MTTNKSHFRIVSFTNPSGKEVFRVTGCRADGKQVRQNFPTLAEASVRQHYLELERQGIAQPSGGMVATRLTADQIADAETAFNRLAGKPLSLAVDFFLANYREPLVKIPLVKAFAHFIQEKTAANKRPDTMRNLSDRVGRFSKLHAEKLVSDIAKPDIEAFINQPGKGLYARVNDRTVLSGFFRWSVKNKFCQINPAENIEKIKVDEGEPSILSLADVRNLVSEAQGYKDGVCLPYVALGLFCAIRPAELARLTWDSIDLKARTVTIHGGAAKRRKRRIVDISKNAAGLLAPHALKQTPIRGLNWRRNFDAVKRLAGIEAGGRGKGRKPGAADLMRHTGVSHHFAFHKHEGKTAEWAGNSPDVIHRHYKGLVTDSEAAAFWKIGTAAAGKIIKIKTAQPRQAAA